jgi:hypothetical protein
MRLEDSPPLLPAALIDTAALEAILRQAGRPETVAQLVEASRRASRAGSRWGCAPHIRRESKIRRITSENVVALLPGDPASPSGKEMVLYGAHLDHMGVGKPVNGDSIYNGASDDAAGVGSILETARAFTRLGNLSAEASWSSSSPPRSAGCWARSGTPDTPRCRSRTWWPTSTWTVRTRSPH